MDAFWVSSGYMNSNISTHKGNSITYLPTATTYNYYANNDTVSDAVSTDEMNNDGRARHCGDNVKYNYTNYQHAMLIGGVYRYNKSNSDLVDTWCNPSTDINPHICLNGSGDPYVSLLKERSSFSCTTVQYKGLGTAVLVASGLGTNTAEITFIEECARSKNLTFCNWDRIINNHSIDLNGPDRVSTAMTNLEGVPTIFGGAYRSRNESAVSSVMGFQHTDEAGDIVNKWLNLHPMDLPRKHHSVVSVPAEFLCDTPSTTPPNLLSTSTSYASAAASIVIDTQSFAATLHFLALILLYF